MKTKSWAILLILFCTFLTSSAQVLYKFGIPSLNFNIMSIITNYYIIGGLCLYGIGAFLMLLAFKGGEVSVLYPIFATSFIWVALMSNFFFQESLNIFKILGIASIILGISLISLGSKFTYIKKIDKAL